MNSNYMINRNLIISIKIVDEFECDEYIYYKEPIFETSCLFKRKIKIHDIGWSSVDTKYVCDMCDIPYVNGLTDAQLLNRISNIFIKNEKVYYKPKLKISMVDGTKINWVFNTKESIHEFLKNTDLNKYLLSLQMLDKTN